jgi:predicted RNA-binding protein YlxR (DUF448 family)
MSHPKADLIRVVRRPDGSVAVDPTGRLAGRGAYVCHEATCLDPTKRKRALDRALETKVPAGLIDELTEMTATTTIDEGGDRGQE